MKKQRKTRDFSEEDIRSSPVPREKLHVKLKIPISTLKKNQDMFEDYKGKMFKQPLVGDVYSELRKRGVEIPLNFSWENFITENKILFTSKPKVEEYNNVEEVKSFKIVDNDLSLACVVSHPDYDHEKAERLKFTSR